VLAKFGIVIGDVLLEMKEICFTLAAEPAVESPVMTLGRHSHSKTMTDNRQLSSNLGWRETLDGKDERRAGPGFRHGDELALSGAENTFVITACVLDHPAVQLAPIVWISRPSVRGVVADGDGVGDENTTTEPVVNCVSHDTIGSPLDIHAKPGGKGKSKTVG
jgi:hypothetical protein